MGGEGEAMPSGWILGVCSWGGMRAGALVYGTAGTELPPAHCALCVSSTAGATAAAAGRAGAAAGATTTIMTMLMSTRAPAAASVTPRRRPRGGASGPLKAAPLCIARGRGERNAALQGARCPCSARVGALPRVAWYPSLSSCFPHCCCNPTRLLGEFG